MILVPELLFFSAQEVAATFGLKSGLKSGAQGSSYTVTNRVIRLLTIYSPIDTPGTLHKALINANGKVESTCRNQQLPLLL